MSLRLTTATAAVLLFITPSGRADLVSGANHVDPPADAEQLSLTDLDFPEFGLSTERRILTIDTTGSPSTSPEINVSRDAYSLPESAAASFGIGRAFLFLLLALIAFAAVKVFATPLRRLWGHQRSSTPNPDALIVAATSPRPHSRSRRHRWR